MRSLIRLTLLVYTLSIALAFNKESIEECAKVLGENFREIFRRATAEEKILQIYDKFVEPEQFDPRLELKRSKNAIENYLKRRAEFAYKAKVSLETREVRNISDEEVNDPVSKDFIRFMSAKQGNDGTTIYQNDHSLTKLQVNETRNFTLVPNANFYSLPTSSVASAVHIPTPLYDRNPELLRKVAWSEIDPVYRTHREETRDLAFQLFCSESGYLRFFPAASWFWDNHEEHLDLFDCRNTEWYINAATNSKNVLIVLDMSGSMLGQRYEIAKQTTEAILETLSHNDFFNIMPFSKRSYFLDDCNGENGLLQATMRNKKVLRERMNNVSSEGKAEYERALPHAFNLLLNISYANGRPDQGCESVIMLITDGAPNAYNEIFDLYNKDKKVRLFSFLIGEEAIDFEEVKQMACYNRGFMVHVQNMADVEEKVQHYIRTMSRPIGAHAADIGIDEALWSGVYRERLYLPRPETFAAPVPITNQSFAVMNKMAARRKIRLQKTEARSRMFVTTVSFPVVVDGTLMGVAAVNIPLTEINQQAHPSNVGPLSYFFMLDQNGFVMFHPQLRPIDLDTKLHKQNYNNMDILELEVPSGSTMRRMVLDCDNSEPQTLEVLYATEILDRVYHQTNTYYSECIQGANFILGLAMQKGDDYRLKRKQKEYNMKDVKKDWVAGNKWRIHPHWRYCLLNDTDYNITKEEAFVVYVDQMVNTGEMPELCRSRKSLVEKLLIDLEATSVLDNLWDQQWQFYKDNEIHLTFFAAPSGLIRHYNLSLDAFEYYDNRWSIIDHLGAFLSADHAQESYNHFVAEVNRKSVDDRYFRRSVRMRDKLVFEIDNKSKIWYKSATHLTGYGHNENMTILGHATKALYTGNALLGVTGFEFGYDWLIGLLSEHNCAPQNSTGRHWCLLLDEAGYIFYSNDNEISYEDYLEDPVNLGKHLGKFMGNINRVGQMVMESLVRQGVYKRIKYIDHQATCKEASSMVQSANRPAHLMRIVFSWLLRFAEMTFRVISKFSLLPFVFHSSEGYTASFHEGADGFPCSREAHFFLINSDKREKTMKTSSFDPPCPGSKCKIKVNSSVVEGTNLLMVWVEQHRDSTQCFDEIHCPMVDPVQSNGSFHWKRYEKDVDPYVKCTGEHYHRPRRSHAMCFDEIIQERKKLPCSREVRIGLSTIVLFLILRVLF